MSITFKDLITTFLAATVFGVYYAMNKGVQLPLITGYRGAILLLAVIGIMMCAFSSTASASWTSPFMVLASILGVVALGLIVYGLIVGTKMAFVLLAMTILALWAVATIRHLFT